jgi:PAS domain S-box-containing protein
MSVPPVTASPQDLVQETLLGEALEHAPAGAIVLDETGRYVAANRHACELSGYTRDELLEGGVSPLAFDSDQGAETMAHVASRKLEGGVAQLRHKDGSAVTCEYRVGATRSGGLPFFLVVFWEPIGS